jgi:hypothetical protein
MIMCALTRNNRCGRPVGSMLLASSLAIACVSGESGQAESSAASEVVVVRDSAGHRIVENFADTGSLPLWQMQLEGAVRLGVEAGDSSQEFGDIIAGLRLGDGSLVVVDAGIQGIRFFSATGQHIRTVGRRGQGPGEYRRIFSAVRLAGDSISIWDNGQWRATLLTPDGRLARTTRIAQPVMEVRPGVTVRGSRLDDVVSAANGRWVSVSRGLAIPPADGPLPALVTVPVPLLSHDERGEVVDTLVVGPGDVWLFIPRPSGYTGISPFRLAQGTSPSWTLKTYVSHGPEFTYVAASKEFEVVAFDRRGTQQWRSRYPTLDREFTKADVEADREIALSSAMTPDRRSVVDYMTDPRWAPPLWPSLGALLADHAGRVWVRSWQPEVDHHRWIVIDEAGRAVAVAETPRRLRISSIDHDHIVAVERDSLGVNYLVVAPIRKTPRSPVR